MKCLDKVEAKFLDAFAKAEDEGDCLASTGDAGDVEARVDALILDTRSALSPAVSSCEPMTLHGASFLANARLTRIEDGKVPCVHAENGEVAKCRFLTESGVASGEWLESAQGRFALTGQGISLEGDPFGLYVVAARVGSDATVPCVEPAGGDSAGTPVGSELAGRCNVETMGTATNFNGHPLRNFATRTVCTSSDPHPDQHGAGETAPLLVSRDCDDTDTCLTCWTGEGAALNDRNGMERGSDGRYLLESGRCHRGWDAARGVEFPASKRPEVTSSFPPRVRTNTPIRWRIARTGIDIANGDGL